jgi:hypothetical protein
MKKIDIYIACPICSQGSRYIMRPEYWKHAGSCQGILQIDEYADVTCKRCGKSAPITKIEFLCPAGKHEFKAAHSTGLWEAFSTSAQMVNAAGNRWFLSVIRHIN